MSVWLKDNGSSVANRRSLGFSVNPTVTINRQMAESIRSFGAMVVVNGGFVVV